VNWLFVGIAVGIALALTPPAAYLRRREYRRSLMGRWRA
jgi:hypothetical protein